MVQIIQAPRLSSLALQHFQLKAPFFALPVTEKRLKTSCPGSQKSHTQGLITLSAVSAYLKPEEYSSNSLRS
jgi:hypothetical protein